ncbi:MAG: hypothetical protein H7249_12430 [Chitinophagaceae bacterium]|nr:hypothetical protein [Oligoflexus sp.]
MTIYLRTALASTLIFSLQGCGSYAKLKILGPNKTLGNVASAEPLGETDANSKAVPMAISLASFKTNIYQPILIPYCTSCHQTTFASSDIAAAHSAFLARVDLTKFDGVDKSLPVVKMKQGHNCWDATAKTCVTTMTDKMSLWLADLAKGGFTPTVSTYANLSSEVAMATTGIPTSLPIPDDYSAAGIDKAMLAAPFTKDSNDIDGPIKTYATSPIATVALAKANNAQAITFTLNAKSAGTYFVWARVKTPTSASKQFFVQANGKDTVPFLLPVTGSEWKWFQVMKTVNKVEGPYSFVAAAGAQSIKILFSQGGTSINQVVITTRSDFNGELFSTPYYDVSVPLTIPGVTGASLIATVWQNSTDVGKKSIGVKHLKISSPVPLHIKGIYPLLNGAYNANQSSYKQIDAVAGGTDATKSFITSPDDAAAIWLADYAADKLSFGFDVLEVAK